MLVFASRMWNKVFKSRFLKGLESQLIYYFYVLVRNKVGTDESDDDNMNI